MSAVQFVAGPSALFLQASGPAILNGSTLAWHALSSIRGGSRTHGRNAPIPKLGFRHRVAHTWFRRVPHPLRFFVSGNIGNVCFFICERLAYHYLSTLPDLPEQVETYKDSVSFLTGYLSHIVLQHYVHALLVYGLDSIDTPAKYWSTLRGMYSALITSAIGSTLLNGGLLHWGLSRNHAFLVTMMVFACINYFWISYIVARSVAREASKSAITDTKRRPTGPPLRPNKKVPSVLGFRAG
jgi:hypothetical protein